MGVDCNVLASTGVNSKFFIMFALALIGAAVFGTFVLRRKLNRSKFWHLSTFLVIGLLFVGVLSLNITPVNAGAAQCTTQPSSAGPSGGAPASQLSLVNDSYNQDNFTYDSEGGPDGLWTGVFNILSNDNSQASDPIDPSSIRLIAPTDQFIDDGISMDVPNGMYFNINGPDGGIMYLEGLDTQGGGLANSNLTGKLVVEFYNSTLPRGLNYTIQYTAKTMSGKDASNTATVTISTPPPNPIRLIDYDQCTFDGDSMSLLDYATTSRGSLDPLSIDLDPSTPGRQTSYINTNGPNTISVDSAGIITFSTTGSNDTNFRNYDYHFTIGNNMGDVSDVGTIHTQSCGG